MLARVLLVDLMADNWIDVYACGQCRVTLCVYVFIQTGSSSNAGNNQPDLVHGVAAASRRKQTLD